MSTVADDPAAARAELLTTAVKPARWPRTAPVTVAARHLRGEPVPFAEAVAGPFEPFAEGERWGPMWDTTWFHVTGTVPDGWTGQRVVLAVHLGYGGGTGFGAEGQVWIDGRPTRGISPHHRTVPIVAPARGGEAVDLFIEAAANPEAPALDPGPLLLPDPDGEPRLVLRRCHLAVVDGEVEALVRDWTLVEELRTWSPDRAVRAAAEIALTAATAAVDPAAVAATAPAAREALAPVLAAVHEAPTHTHLAVGNSHLDTAWLWPLRETRRKAVRTFSNAASLLDEHPGYTFAASQAQQFAWIRDDQPDLWRRIREHVEAGRFDLVGSMWVEADCNLPSGESLVRQIVHGRRFFRDELGVDTPGLWLPDVFGYSAALPQILAAAGIDWFLTQKLSWNDTNRFPHHTFWWEGIDGTRVFTHFPPADTYSGDLSVANLVHGAANFAQAGVRSQSLYLYGHGDGGGGPTREQIERAGQVADLSGVPRVALTTASDAMTRLMAEGDPAELPVWVGELYLELHRGTYTTHGWVKQANRRLELALRDAELWSVAARGLAGLPTPTERLDRAWKLLLLHQFHDIIPGSSIHWVYDDTRRDLTEAAADAQAVIDDAVAAMAAAVAPGSARRPALALNPLPFARHELVPVDGSLVPVEVPPCGWAVVDLDDPPDLAAPPVATGDGWMDNGLLRVAWDDLGLLTSVRHLPSGREALAPGGRGNLLQLLEDRPAQWDAWDIDREAFATARDVTDAEVVELVERSPDRATLRVVRRFGRSRIEQEVRLTRGSGRVEVHCEVDWHEDHTLLKVAFPLDVRTPSARHEIQFGHVERPTHANTTWDAARFETCAHTWVDLSEPGFGVALLNDSKYGHDVSGNVVRLSLLRAPTWPDPVADRGRHTFAYALHPHTGSPADGGVVAEAHAFNSPLRVVPFRSDPPALAGSGPSRGSVLTVDDPGIVIAAVKPADDGDGVIVRLHEAFGGRRAVTLTVPGATGAVRVDLLEAPLDGGSIPVADGRLALGLGPFELVTLRLTGST